MRGAVALKIKGDQNLVEKLHNQVKRFMELGDQPMRTSPGIPDEETIVLGISLIKEECVELIDSITALVDVDQKEAYVKALAKVADAIGDILYVTAWNGLAWGFPMPEIMEEIQRANLEKFGPGSWKDENGKVRKPPHWQPPDLEKVLKGCVDHEISSEEEVEAWRLGNVG